MCDSRRPLNGADSEPIVPVASGVAEAWGGHALIPDTDEHGRLVFRNSWADTEAARRLYDEAKEMDRLPED